MARLPYFLVLLAVAILLLLTSTDVLFCPPAPILNMHLPAAGGDSTAPNADEAAAGALKAWAAPKAGAGAPKAKGAAAGDGAPKRLALEGAKVAAPKLKTPGATAAEAEKLNPAFG